jgi:hypothetical protein
MAQQKDNTGVLFANHKRTTDKHPNSKGSATIDGVECWVAGWTKTTGSGEKYISLAFTPKDTPAESSVQKRLDDDDEEVSRKGSTMTMKTFLSEKVNDMKKVCFKCGEEKELLYFYRHKAMADGHLNKCALCTKRDVSEYRQQNIARIRAYDRVRGKMPRRLRQAAEQTKKYRKKNPLRYAANLVLNNSLRSGKIKKPEQCSMCMKKTRLCGHHSDYSQPLAVLWLCQICHKKVHSLN